MPYVAYELTQTINPRYNTKYTSKDDPYKNMIASEQYKWYKGIHEQIFQTEHNVETYFVCEFHKNFNLHFHGICMVSPLKTPMELVDIAKKCNKLGRSTFRPISNIKKWLEYMNKNQDEIEDTYRYKSRGYDIASKMDGGVTTIYKNII